MPSPDGNGHVGVPGAVLITGVAGFVVARGMQEAAAAGADGVLDPLPLITHSAPLAEPGRAFELMRERPDGFMKAPTLP